MNRENKRRTYVKGYYKKYPCSDSFICKNCGWAVNQNGAGTDHRNHCPNCLCSVHLDITPGDRSADCGALMEPIAVWVRKGGEWALIHRCRMCGSMSSNRIAADDNPMNDAHEHRDAPSLSAAVSAGKNTGDDKVYLHRKLQITFQLKEQGEFSLFFQLF